MLTAGAIEGELLLLEGNELVIFDGRHILEVSRRHGTSRFSVPLCLVLYWAISTTHCSDNAVNLSE